MASITCGHCKGNHLSVGAVRACAGANGVVQGTPSFDARVQAEQIRVSTILRGDAPAPIRTTGTNRPGGLGLDNYYRKTNAAERAEEDRQAGQVRTRTRAAEGMYRKAGTIYKVQVAVHGNGQTYAKRLVETLVIDPKSGKTKWRFEYAKGFVFELRPEHALTLAQAAEFGVLYGTCCVCGRTLTDENSIEAGIGPVCAKKF